MKNWPRLVPKASAILLAIVAFLGLNEPKDLSLAPGYHTGFKAFEDGGATPVLHFATGGRKDLKCFVRVTVISEHPETSSFTAALGEKPLRVHSESHLGTRRILMIVEADTGNVSLDKFDWPSGKTLRLVATNPRLGRLELVHWEVWPTDAEFDSKDRAARRVWTLWISLVVLGMLTAGGLWQAPEKVEPKPPTTVESLIVEQIDLVEGQPGTDGEPSEETVLMRKVLHRVLVEGAGTEETVNTLPFARPLDRKNLWFRARAALRRRLRNFTTLLSDYDRRMGS